MTVESTAWTLTLKRRSRPLPLRPAAKSGLACWRWPSSDQKSFSANSALRSLLAWERAFLDGGVTPKRASTQDLRRSQSHTSLRPMAWESWAKSIAERWLTTLKVRALAATPVSKARRLTIPRGMRLRICLRTSTLDRAGGVLFITPYRVAGISTQHQPTFSLQVMPSCGTAANIYLLASSIAYLLLLRG